MSKIKICHLTSAHSSKDTRILYKECVSLAKKDIYQVYLVAEGKTNTIENVEIIGVGQKPINRIKRIISFTKNVYTVAKKIDADIYHLHDPELLPYAIRLKKTGKIVIFDAHENYELLILEKKYINVIFRKTIQNIFNIYYKRILKKIDGVIGVTPNMEKYLKLSSDNVCIITNYPIIERAKKNINEKSENCILVFAGGVNSKWCHNIIIKNIQSIDKIKYKLIGPSTDEYSELLKQIDINDKVEYLGKLNHKTIHDELLVSDIGVAIVQYTMNSFADEGTMGNTKIFEEMTAGLAIVCTDFSLWKNLIIDKYKCGICVNPNNDDQIKEAILKLVNNPELRKKMGENSRRAVEEEFNWGTQEKCLFDFYAKLLQNKKEDCFSNN